MASHHRTYLVFLGPPGSGKGTQARILQDRLGLPQVSTGDLFRHHFKQQTALGRLAQTYIDAGELVPDQVTINMVEKRLEDADCENGVLFDGFPRNLEQVMALERLLQPFGGVTLVPMLDVSDEEVMKRITGRRVCRSCGAVYHVDYNPPRITGICDLDGGELYQRADDGPETVKNRLYVYYKQTSPLVGYYFAKKLLLRVNGEQAPGAVTQTLIDLLAARGIG